MCPPPVYGDKQGTHSVNEDAQPTRELAGRFVESKDGGQRLALLTALDGGSASTIPETVLAIGLAGLEGSDLGPRGAAVAAISIGVVHGLLLVDATLQVVASLI